MSYWGATVITNLFSAIPIVGEGLKTWLLGDYTVGNATLNRFFALHYVLPFVIFGVVGLHVSLLHQISQREEHNEEQKTYLKLHFQQYSRQATKF